jgi:DNA topoisomerase-1
MIITRHGTAPNFKYMGVGKGVKNTTTLAYIAALVIPPKYTDVRIHYTNGAEPAKLTYTGIDEAGRTQYGYSKRWKIKARKKKFADLIEFGRALPRIRLDVAKQLKVRADTMEHSIAIILSIVMNCHIRIGNLKYKDLYKSYGATNLEVRHVSIKPGVARISFIGKKGVRNICKITNAALISNICSSIKDKKPHDAVFTYDKCGSAVRASDINDYMGKFGTNITSKMFRTYATNVMLIGILNDDDPTKLTKAERKRRLNIALDSTSNSVHNTRAVCRREYVHPEIPEMYINKPHTFVRRFTGAAPESMFLAYLKKYV